MVWLLETTQKFQTDLSLYMYLGTALCKNGFNPLPDDKILDWSKLKQIADNILKYI